MKELDYNKKMEICEKLGAKQFQKFVFGIEAVKWKAIKKFVPNYIKYVDKVIEHDKERLLKKANNEEEIDNVRRIAMLNKMNVRREYNNSENINYHIASRPSEFLVQLEWNKDVHKRGLKYNFIFFPLFVGASVATAPIAVPISAIMVALSVLTAFSMFINFECINIQNYNICRLKKSEEKLLAREARKAEKETKIYEKAYESVGKTLEAEKDIVDADKIVSNIKTKEAAEQLKALIQAEMSKRNKEPNQISNGGKKLCI